MYNYIESLSRQDKEILLHRLIVRMIDIGEIGFCEGEDPNYQGTYTLNSHFYWKSSGEDVLAPIGDNNV